MEQLRSELALVLGEPVSRVECISQQPYASLYTLYDGSGQPLPLVARYFRVQGAAGQEAHKLSILAREGKVRVPIVHGLVISQQMPRHEVLLIERISGFPLEMPMRTPDRWRQLREQIVVGLLSWHRIDSRGLVGNVDSTQQNSWPAWYAQRIEVLWASLNYMRPTSLGMEDWQILFRSRARLASLFVGFDDPCVLVHGNLTLNNMLREARSDRLLAMINPGPVQWAPREFELYPLCETGIGDEVVGEYLQSAPVAEGFVARRWLYIIWEEVARLIHCAQFDHARFRLATHSLLPWLT